MPESIEHNFETIAMDKGEVSTKFKLTNEGEEPITVTNMFTSCMCTSAILHTEEGSSNKVGMRGHGIDDEINMVIEPGKNAEVEAIFDPNAHGPQGTGVNRRNVTLQTNSTAAPELQFNFTANVVGTSEEIPLN